MPLSPFLTCRPWSSHVLNVAAREVPGLRHAISNWFEKLYRPTLSAPACAIASSIFVQSSELWSLLSPSSSACFAPSSFCSFASSHASLSNAFAIWSSPCAERRARRPRRQGGGARSRGAAHGDERDSTGLG